MGISQHDTKHPKIKKCHCFDQTIERIKVYFMQKIAAPALFFFGKMYIQNDVCGN